MKEGGRSLKIRRGVAAFATLATLAACSSKAPEASWQEPDASATATPRPDANPSKTRTFSPPTSESPTAVPSTQTENPLKLAMHSIVVYYNSGGSEERFGDRSVIRDFTDMNINEQGDGTQEICTRYGYSEINNHTKIIRFPNGQSFTLKNGEVTKIGGTCEIKQQTDTIPEIETPSTPSNTRDLIKKYYTTEGDYAGQSEITQINTLKTTSIPGGFMAEASYSWKNDNNNKKGTDKRVFVLLDTNPAPDAEKWDIVAMNTSDKNQIISSN